MFRFTYVLVLVAVMASAAFAQSPYLFTPSGRDDAAALRAALIAYRRVQINGTDIRIDTPINLVTDDGVPFITFWWSRPPVSIGRRFTRQL